MYREGDSKGGDRGTSIRTPKAETHREDDRPPEGVHSTCRFQRWTPGCSKKTPVAEAHRDDEYRPKGAHSRFKGRKPGCSIRTPAAKTHREDDRRPEGVHDDCEREQRREQRLRAHRARQEAEHLAHDVLEEEGDPPEEARVLHAAAALSFGNAVAHEETPLLRIEKYGKTK